MLILITILTFILLFIGLNGLFAQSNKRRDLLQKRLAEISSNPAQSEVLDQKSFKEKLTDSLSDLLEKGFYHHSNSNRREQLQRALENAGYSKSMTPVKYLLSLMLTALLILALTVILVYVISLSFGKSLMIGFLTVGLYLYLQRFMLLRQVEQRRRRIIKDLPYTLDLILVSVEAGLSFDGAIAKVVTNIPGPIADEFGKTLKEIRMGITRKVAMKNMSTRCNIKELSTLNTAIIQADELGVSLSNIIRIQGAMLREERKQKAREKALKAPVKILLPLILFIFPTIFIVILGPSLMKIAEIFK